VGLHKVGVDAGYSFLMFFDSLVWEVLAYITGALIDLSRVTSLYIVKMFGLIMRSGVVFTGVYIWV